MLWAVAGAACALGFLALPSFGVFLLPVALIAVAVLGMRGTPHLWGASIGVGLVLCGVGAADLLDGVGACTSGVSSPPSPGRPSHCEEGGIPGGAFVAVGVLGLLAGAADAVGARSPRR